MELKVKEPAGLTRCTQILLSDSTLHSGWENQQGKKVGAEKFTEIQKKYWRALHPWGLNLVQLLMSISKLPQPPNIGNYHPNILLSESDSSK